VVELIRREAARYGVAIHHSELVGLIPQEALIDGRRVVPAAGPVSSRSRCWRPAWQPSGMLPPAPNRRSPVRAFWRRWRQALLRPARLSGSLCRPPVCRAGRHGGAPDVGKKKYAAVESQMQALAAQQIYYAAGCSRPWSRMPPPTAGDCSFQAAQGHARKQQARLSAIEQATLGAIQVPLETAQHARGRR